jgi:very-short-patch-repair endonuclease
LWLEVLVLPLIARVFYFKGEKMDIDKMLQDWKGQKFTEEYKKQSEEFDFIDSLCSRVRKIIYLEKAMGNNLFNLKELSEFIKKYTPIEQMFYLTWIIYKNQSNYLKNTKLRICPQCEVKVLENKYKVDFLFPFYWIQDKLVPLKNPVIVECDGYDSHSSKEQRNYDTKRENDLKMAGYSVIRFTGSQIYNDPYKCVIQTAKFIYDRNKSQLEKEIEEFGNVK